MKGRDAESHLPRKKADRGSTSQSPLDEAPRQVPITVLLGPADPLLQKLDSLKTPGQNLPSDLFSADEVSLLKDLCIRLKDMSEDEDVMVQWWMKMVRELCYDTVDHLEEVIIGAPVHQDLSVIIGRAKDARKSLDICQRSPPKVTQPADQGGAGVSQLTFLHRRSKAAVVVPSKLVELLALEDKESTLKVVPINGCAGVGKTTVARELYRTHGSTFQCQAFVTVSRNPFTRGFLISMLSQLKAPRPPGCPDVPDLIDAIKKHLQGKRYFIVIDDLWTATLWNIISRAFPHGDSCSRIIATTQIDDVALACCGYDPNYIYEMKPLDCYKSLELFFAIEEVSNTTLVQELECKKHTEQMKYVLELIYRNLSPRLRTCLLYLSMYAQGYVIKKDELVKLWVVEGFLSAEGSHCPEDISKRCFEKLVSRGMIQAVDTDNSKVSLCSVHQIVLDFIRHKSREENFVTTVDYNHQSTLVLPDKVRRLSVQFGGVKSAYIPESIVTSHVRSLIFWGFYKCIPSSFADYGLLRVLILHIWADEDNGSVDLSGIGELFLLKYLKIECNVTVKLPSMTNGLPSLTALDLYIQTAPADGIVIGKDGFKVLMYFKFMCPAPCLSFGPEAMPQVQKLELGFNSNKMKPDSFRIVGFPNLARLTEVSVQVGDAGNFDPEAAKSALESAAWNPLNPREFSIQRSDVIFFAEEDKSTETEEKEKKRQEIQEGKKKIMEHSEEHVNKQDERRYARTGLVSMKHHAPSVDIVMGALGSLLPKLLELKDEYNLEAEVKGKVESLLKELKALQAPLREVEKLEKDRLHEVEQLEKDRLCEVAKLEGDRLQEVAQLEQAPLHEAGQRDEMLNAWARDVWDLSYDAEDIIDSLSVRIEGSDPDTELKDSIESLILRTYALLSKEKDCHKIASNVFIDGVIEKLGPHEAGDLSEKLKIVSIVGMGGLGKTTLAKTVYYKIQEQYKYNLFISVSRDDPCTREVCKQILTKFGVKPEHKTLRTWSRSENWFISEVGELLEKKRYLIVIDEIWDIESWKSIKSALIDSNCGSKVVITTRIMKVTEEVGGVVYQLKGLSCQDSEALLNKRLLCGQEEVPSDLLKVSEKLLSKCDGVPSAIITMASLLVGKPTDDWSKVYDSIVGFGSGVRGNTYLEHYCRLSSNLRSCLLHLHIFPEDRLIKKETLIWKWAAEGLIVKEQKTKKGLFEIGEGYLTELIDKKLLMQVEDDSHPWKVIGYHVDKLVFEMICSLSTQKNFVTVTDGSKQYSHIESKARRLAVQKWTVEQVDPLANIRPERLRSINTMGCPFSTELSLSRFQLLRVLALEECTLVEGNLSQLGKLLLLRYLGLYNTHIKKLPEDIGDLIYLQTLDLRGTRVKELPGGVARLRQLKCLRADQDTAVPDWAGDITSLEELRLGKVSMSNFVTELGRLRELRELEISIEGLDKNKNKALVHFIGKLEKIQVLRLMDGSSSSGHGADWTDFIPPPTLRELHLSIAFPRLPKWINNSSVAKLSHLYVNVKAFEEEDLDVLADLKELICLQLLMPLNTARIVKGDFKVFTKLRCFHASAPFRFDMGAMRKLESLQIKVGDMDTAKVAASTFGNLRSIKRVEVQIWPNGDVEAMREALKGAVGERGNSLSLHVVKTDEVGIAHRTLL